MSTLSVFDPAMCCSTGVCGPTIDPQLMRFAADLEWLGEQGVAVERFNLAQQPMNFAETPAVRDALQAAGEKALPMLLTDGRVLSSGIYPTRGQLAGWFGLTVAPRVGMRRAESKGDCGCKSGCC